MKDIVLIIILFILGVTFLIIGIVGLLDSQSEEIYNYFDTLAIK